MIKTTINIDNIESVSLIDKKEHNTIQWTVRERKEWSWKKFKYETIQSHGYYDTKYDYVYFGLHESEKDRLFLTSQELEKNYPDLIIKSGIVYRRPKVKIALKSGEVKTKEFSNLHEADLYYQALNRKLTNKTEL